MRLFFISLYGLLLLAVSTDLQAQQQSEVKTISKNGSTIEITTAVQQDGKPSNHYIVKLPEPQKESLSGERRVLVKFKGQPLARKNSRNSSALSRALDQEHARFLRDLQQLVRRTKTSGKAAPKILTEFKIVFNGYALVIPTEIEDEIRKLSYVVSVVEDQKVEAIDESSNQVIKADRVWADLNITGRGIVIGIIDTGIDYNHADLGGGIGSSFKVLGGYDFVNNDNDPVDDHGHGTHVAGIAAANGSIRGVAPDAKLMAYKVLDKYGYGFDSWIIAAIERSVDPDQNPATNDALDIVNMSLGRSPQMNDPYVEAIANATALGVTFVVAAGNSYDHFMIGSPGVAPDAITVGATDLSDVTALFSSKGPTEFSYQIKPDVSAPGVEINSTFLQNQFTPLSGTSMASPHVAGAAALLLEKNPSWTPEMIKGALMNYAKPGTDPYWNQGAGRIDILKSIQSDFMVTPGSISLGKYNDSQPEQKTFKTKIYNTAQHAKQFSLSVTGDIINPHVTPLIQPSTVTLNPGESTEITVTFNTTPGLAFKSFTEGYFGELFVTSGEESIRVPIAMVCSKITRLIFSTPLPNRVDIIGINGSTYSKIILPTAQEMEVIIPNGQVEIVAAYGYKSNAIVIKEAVEGAAGGDILLTRDLAKNRIVFAFKDINDQVIPINPFVNSGVSLFSSQKLVGMYMFPVDTFFVSDNSVAKFDFTTRDMFSNVFYDLGAGVTGGQNQSITILKNADLKFTISPGDELDHQWQYISQGYHRGNGFKMVSIPYTTSGNIEFYAAERKSTDSFNYSKAIIESDHDEFIETGMFKFFEDDVIEFVDGVFLNYRMALYKSPNFTYELGESLLRWNGRMVNQADRIVLYDAPSIGLFNYALNERNREELDYELKSNGQTVSSGKILNRTFELFDSYEPVFQLSAVPNLYSLSVKNSKHKVNEVQGHGQIDLEFDTRKDDKDPPNLSFFNLYRDGVTTNTIKSGEHASFVIGLSDCNIGYNCYYPSGIATSRLYIKHDNTDWQELELTRLKDDTLVADILEGLPEGYYSAKITSSDFAGNNFTYTLSPAFFVGPAEVPPVTKLKLLQPLNHAVNVGRSVPFIWEDVDAVSYTFELSKTPAFVTIESTVTIAENELTLPFALDYNSIYYWKVRPNYTDGPGIWSDISDFRSIEHKTNLIFPENQSRQSSISFVNFEWEELPGASLYHIQVSRNPAFSDIVYEYGVQNTSIGSWLIPEDGVTYYWRVRCYLSIGVYVSWSDVFSFTGDFIPQKVQLAQPFNNSEVITRKPTLSWSYVPLGVSYTLQISRDEDFAQLEVEHTTEGFSYEVSEALLSADTFYWRVRANYQNESGEWSDVFRFTIQEEEIELIQPANNSFWISAARVNFTWKNISFSSTYHLQISKDPQFSSIEYQTEVNESVLEWETFPEVDQVYYWRVRPYFLFGYYGDWSETFTFTGEDDGYVTTLLSPGNNSINADQQPVFDWLRSSYAYAYTFQISKTADFSVVDSEQFTSGDLEFVPELDFSTRYYWRVRAHYDGETKPWSEVFNFRVHDLMLTLNSPADQSVQTSSAIDFEWNELNNVAQYHFQLSKDEAFTTLESEEEVSSLQYHSTAQLKSNSTYFWRVRPYYNLDYFGEWSVPFSFTTDIVTGLPEETNLRKTRAYPNPFTGSVAIEFYLDRAGDVSLELVNPQGQVIDRVTKYFPLTGKQSLEWNVHESAPGVYVCKITSAYKTEVVKLIRTK